MAKRVEANIKIKEMRFPNIGVGEFLGESVHIKNALPNQIVFARIAKKKGRLHGRLLEVVEKSQSEVSPECKQVGFCGGCTFATLIYNEELEIKKQMVGDVLNIQNLKITASPSEHEYRNKMEFSFGDLGLGEELGLGMRARGTSYEVADARDCNLVNSDFRQIVAISLDFFRESGEPFYHKGRFDGVLRNLIVRAGLKTNEILVNIVTTSNLRADLSTYAQRLQEALPNIVGVIHTINNSTSDAVKPEEVITISGRDYFFEEVLGLRFKISPFSFFQTNTYGAEVLYSKVRDFLGNTDNDVIFDLYSGTGTIASILSTTAKEVYAIEIVREAVEMAIENAKINNITNVRFICGDVKDEVKKLNIQPDVIVIDPPRDGIHEKALSDIINFNAKKIIYISCKPTSLARDLEILREYYDIEQVELVDMFPKTYHVETVVALHRR